MNCKLRLAYVGSARLDAGFTARDWLNPQSGLEDCSHTPAERCIFTPGIEKPLSGGGLIDIAIKIVGRLADPIGQILGLGSGQLDRVCLLPHRFPFPNLTFYCRWRQAPTGSRRSLQGTAMKDRDGPEPPKLIDLNLPRIAGGALASAQGKMDLLRESLAEQGYDPWISLGIIWGIDQSDTLGDAFRLP